jgi:hypothetical protein
MKTVKIKASADVVKSMREIRDNISNEIINMTYAEERAFLDGLLQQKEPFNIQDAAAKTKSILS